MPTILVALLATIANIVAVCREFRKTAAFVITAVVWSLFLWLFGLLSDRLDLILADVNTAQAGGAVGTLGSLFGWFDKLEYMFPVYTAFRCLGLYMSVRVSALLLHYLLKAWETVPFKGSAGA